jgi:RNA polymerase sigma-70 factor (ECF subfamily)
MNGPSLHQPSDPCTSSEQVYLKFVQHEGTIRAFIRALQPPLPDADGVLLETFLTVSRMAPSFEPGTNFVAKACEIARLKVLENSRQRKRATVSSEAAIIALSEVAPPEEMTGIKKLALSRCLEKPAPKSWNLWWRRYSERQSSDEIANAPGITSTAVCVALSKARAFLRNCVTTELRNPSQLK